MDKITLYSEEKVYYQTVVEVENVKELFLPQIRTYCAEIEAEEPEAFKGFTDDDILEELFDSHGIYEVFELAGIDLHKLYQERKAVDGDGHYYYSMSVHKNG